MSGRLVRFIGRKGSGPGELRQPASLATSGDTLLGAWDLAQRRVVLWDLRTGKPRSAFSLGGWFPQLHFERGKLRVAAVQGDSAAAVVRMTIDGDQRVAEGVIPELLKRSPVLVGGFGGVFVADDGEDSYAVFEVANQLFRWRQGSRTATATGIPRKQRRGVRTELFDEILRNPDTAASLAFDRSVPVALHRLSAGRLGLVTMDGALQKGTNFVGTFHLTLLDVVRGRACVDAVVPTRSEPLPSLAFAGDTLAVLQQGEDASGQPGTWITRYVVDPGQCTWLTMEAPRPVR